MRKRHSISLFQVIVTIMTFLFVAFIFIHSTMNAEDSGNESLAALGILQSFFQSLGIPLELTDFIVRKTAHFLEFAVLGSLTTLSVYAYYKKPWRKVLQICFLTLAVAVTDETIQLFVPGRSGRVQDVWIDFAGACCGILILFFICWMLTKKKKRRT